jgi:tetratricopeptide (TPR) repeat protein
MYKLERDEVEGLVDQANSIFPKSEHLYGQVLGQYPDLLSNLEGLLKRAERCKLDIYKILELRKNLLISYFYLLDFKRTNKQLTWFAANKKEIITKGATAKQLLPAVIFLVGDGHYKHFIEDNVKQAIKDFEEAIKIVKDKYIEEIKCFVYEEYAQILLCSGDVDLAWEKIKVAQGELSNPKGIIDKGMVYYTLSTIYMEKGEYEDALSYIDTSIAERLKLGHSTFSELNYEVKATMLLRIGKYKEAFAISKASCKRINKYFKEDHDLKSRALIFLAWSELGLGKLRDAEAHISEAKAFFRKQKGDVRNGGEYLAYISIVEGEIEKHKKNYAEAVKRYIEAGKNLKKVYKNLKNDFYGLILERIISASIIARQEDLQAQYLLEYKTIFGKQGDRGKHI